MELKTTNNFKIESLGIKEEWVYDLEVEDNHNFFGNDILVHNSNYVLIQPVVDIMKKKKMYENQDDLIKDILVFNDTIVQPLIDKTFKETSDYLNSYDYKMSMKLEKIIKNGLFSKKKKYILRTIYDEGTYYRPYKDKTTGMAMKNVNYSPIIIKWLEESLDMIFDDNIDGIRKFIKEKRKEFKQLDLTEISQSVKVNKYGDYIREFDSHTEILESFPNHFLVKSLSEGKLIKGGDYLVMPKCNPTVRGAAFANYLIRKHKLMMTEFNDGDHCNLLYLKDGLQKIGIADSIVFNHNQELINIFKKYVDYDKQFDSFFMEPLNTMLTAANMSLARKSSIFVL